MKDVLKKGRRCILGVFAHPDDETSSCAGTFTHYARQGVEIDVVSATRGELGTLGTGGLVVAREELPAVREAEMRSVLRMYGAQPPVFLGYKDQELGKADFDELVGKVASVMEGLRPDVVITFGPSGISHHEDHVTIHGATVEAFLKYHAPAHPMARLFYVAIPRDVADKFDLHLDDSETNPTVIIDIRQYRALKIQALRTYRSQEDAQQLADMVEDGSMDVEGFHQAYPTFKNSLVSPGFW